MRFLIALILSAVTANAATVTITCTNSAGQADTNFVRVYPISTPIFVSGSWTITGLPQRVVPTNGVSTLTNLLQGNYQASNSVLNFIFAVPSGSGTYAAESLRISGGNVYNYSPALSESAIQLSGVLTNTQSGVTLPSLTSSNANLPSATLTNAFAYSGTNTFGPSVTNYSAITNFYITAVSWDANLGGLYEWQSEEIGNDDDLIYFASNGTYGLIANTVGQSDYPHFFTVTNGAGTTVAYSDSTINFPASTQLRTNAVLSDAYISFATNTAFAGGWYIAGQVHADLRESTNYQSSKLVWDNRPVFDGSGLTNVIPPANWGAAQAQTPQFGWNSYLQTSCSVNENEVLAVGATWAANGTLAAGPCWIWIDCSWGTTATDNVNANFPNGITNVVNILHAYLVNNNRYKVGIYLGSDGLPFGPPVTPATVSNIVATFAGWGIDGIKVDGALIDPNLVMEKHLFTTRLMASAILATRTNMLLDITIHAASGSELGPKYLPAEIFNDAPMWEATSLQEVGGGVNHDLSTADILRPILWATQRGRIGQLLFNNEQGGGGTENGMTNALNMNLLWPSWVHVGWTNATATKYWTNSELRQILSDGFVAHNREIYSNSYTRIWARPLGSFWPGNKYLVGFINGMTTGAATSNLTITATMLGWPTNTPMLIHDPYRQADTNTLTDSFTVTVTTNQTTLYVISLASLGASTNAQTTTVDMRIKRGDLQTTGVLTFAGIKNKSTTDYQTAVIHVFNTTGSAVGIVAPPNTLTNGTLPYNVTNYSVVNITYHPLYGWTNMLVIPIR